MDGAQGLKALLALGVLGRSVAQRHPKQAMPRGSKYPNIEVSGP